MMVIYIPAKTLVSAQLCAHMHARLTRSFAVIVEVLQQNCARIDGVHVARHAMVQFGQRTDFRAIVAAGSGSRCQT